MNSIEVAIDSLGGHAQKYAVALEKAMIEGGILSALEKAHFLAQIAHESAMFTAISENLNYSAAGLRKVFPTHFTDAEALIYGRKPEAIANRAYAGRNGNGNEASGEGWKYRGRGLIQLTGKVNYKQASLAIYKDTRLLDYPDMACEPDEAAKIAVWFWNMKDCCGPAKRDDTDTITKRINGGLNGLEDRKQLLAKFKQLFT